MQAKKMAWVSAMLLACAGYVALDVARPAVAQAPLVQGLPDFSTLVEAVGPAVVNISVTGKAAPQAAASPFSPNDPMFEFFRRFGMPIPMIPQPEQAPAPHGIGSGFILSEDGYILTNAHVVANAGEVVVKLTDKRELKATIVGFDRRTDVALIKVEARGLPVVKIGDSNRVRVGEWVVAVGSPFGFDSSVTAGIVSAKARQLPDENYVPFIQTDVAINPGNSGGPLFNMRGEVIGINSQIYSRTGGYMGLSFAIPMEVAMRVKNQLQKTGKVSRGKLGVGVQPMSRELAESFGLDKPRGALIGLVEKGSAAEKAGLMAGDVILSVNGTPLNDTADLPRIIGELGPGGKAALSVWRQKAARDVVVTLAEATDGTTPAAPAAPAEGPLGLAVRELRPDEASALGVMGGLAVESASGIAARSGVQPGDVILAVNNQPVSDGKSFGAAVKAAGKRVALLIQRGGSRIYLPLKMQ
ncbi:MAG: hypothetical protein RIR70_1207 [Pseudomonadota bacterium]